VLSQVLVDGQDVNKLTAASLRASVGLVQQEAALFNEDIAYNIAYARDDASPEAVFPEIVSALDTWCRE